MDNRPQSFRTESGMVWYPEDSEAVIFVKRLAVINGRMVLRIWANSEDRDIDNYPMLEVTVSKQGRVIRTYPVQGNVRQGDL